MKTDDVQKIIFGLQGGRASTVKFLSFFFIPSNPDNNGDMYMCACMCIYVHTHTIIYTPQSFSQTQQPGIKNYPFLLFFGQDFSLKESSFLKVL